jgi:hypothetical protein
MTHKLTATDEMLGVLIETERDAFVVAYAGPPEQRPNPSPNGFGLELVSAIAAAVADLGKGPLQAASNNVHVPQRLLDMLLGRGFQVTLRQRPGYYYGVDLVDPRRPLFMYQRSRTQQDIEHGEPLYLGATEQARKWMSEWRPDIEPPIEAAGDLDHKALRAFGRYVAQSPNVFLLAGKSDEDWFTNAWHYLLCKRPAIGQRIVDFLSEQASLPPSRYRFTVDHPLPDDKSANYPDFLVQADPEGILFEHKLTADLGDLQLERYLSTAQSMGTRLALVAARPVPVPKKVLASPLYLRPKSRDAAHFFWQDFARLLSEPALAEDDLVQDFVEVMDHLGLRYSDWAGIGDPLIAAEAKSEFRRVLAAAAKRLSSEAELVKLAPRNPGIELRKPAPGVGLVYFLFGARGHALRGRVALAQVGVDSPDRLPRSDAIRHQHFDVLPGARALYYAGKGVARWNKDMHFARYYEIPLDLMLAKSSAETIEAVCAVIKGVLGHLRSETSPHAPPRKERRPVKVKGTN